MVSASEFAAGIGARVQHSHLARIEFPDANDRPLRVEAWAGGRQTTIGAEGNPHDVDGGRSESWEVPGRALSQRYHGDPGRERPGVLDESGHIRDLSSIIRDVAGDTLGEHGLSALRSLDLQALGQVEPGVRIGPCVGSVGKIVCVGLNYSDHAAEADMAIPREPVLFMKATSAICGPYDDLRIPRGGGKTDWEVELGVVIGRQAAYVSESEAMQYVAGYCAVNDVSERGFQLEREGQWVKGKSCDTFAPLGPWLVTCDEIADPQNLDMWLQVDGRRYQEGSSRTMIFGVARLVSYISEFMRLEPGDVISTGTPPGVGLGQQPPVYLEEGQLVELGISGLGQQRQRVVKGR